MQSTHTLKPGDKLTIKATPGTSQIIELVIADGTRIQATITSNTPCIVLCGRLGIDVNINGTPDDASGINVITLGDGH